MKTKTQRFVVLFIFILLSSAKLFSQSNPQALKPGITINRILTVQDGSIRVVKDPVSGHFLYTTTDGNIYEVLIPGISAAYDSLIYTVADHGVQYVQGMTIRDSVLYVSGNNDSSTPLTTGIIVKGVLQPNGTRVWSTLMQTDPYQTADYFDHLFSGMALNPAGDSILICSGARGDHGEIQDRYGAYPDFRNVPLTTNLYILPTHDAATVVLQNDSSWIASSGFLYARGIRNTFDMAFDRQGRLFGVENSGDRDQNEEMNWMRRGHHYGFPWKMGDSYNPQQFASFDPATDLLISHYSRSWRLGFFGNDPLFPAPPTGIVFDEPIQNIGPDCDKFRDSLTGTVMDASDLGTTMGTFTAHRSPLGLVFDNDSVMHPNYRGDAFMLSWTIGLDSCGCIYTTDSIIGPFVDPSEDLVHLHLVYDSLIDNFSLSATRIVAAFSHPVDDEIDSNKIYVLENGYGGTAGLYEVIMPYIPVCVPNYSVDVSNSCDTGMAFVVAHGNGYYPVVYQWKDTLGVIIRSDTLSSDIDTLQNIFPGNYIVEVSDSFGCAAHVPFIVATPADLQILSVTGTTCIGCNNGSVSFNVPSGPFNISWTPSIGVLNGNNIDSLPAGEYSICITDSMGCISCDTIEILDDPSSATTINSSDESFSVYPNPANGEFLIVSNILNEKIEIALSDVTGREVYCVEKNLSGKEKGIRVTTTNFSNGIYVLKIKVNQSLFMRKIIVQH